MSAELENMESFDGFATMRNMLRAAAELKGAWAGIPMPLQDHALVVEPRYPHAEVAILGKQKPEPDLKIRNRFHCGRKRCWVATWDGDDGKIHWGVQSTAHHFTLDIQTIGASHAWGIEQESQALQTLAGLVRHHTMKHYLLTGMFLESSERSGVLYVFRKLRPTVALRAVGDELRILATLCMHPIGYYDRTWGGVMSPTDDVIAHLMLMRGDEKKYWRRCNQHPAWAPEAGL